MAARCWTGPSRHMAPPVSAMIFACGGLGKCANPTLADGPDEVIATRSQLSWDVPARGQDRPGD